jgi:hypothetical protein
VSALAIADTFADFERMQRDGQERTYPERLYRRISRQIDDACDRVELENLAGGTECPAEVGAFLAQLHRQAGELMHAPRTTMQAHDELFRLSCVLLGRPAGDLDFDREDEAAELEAER